MKNIHLITLLALSILLISSCSVPGEEEIPEGIEAQKELLNTKRKELKVLSSFITQLEDTIAEQDPTFRKKTRTLVTTEPIVRKEFVRYIDLQGAVQENEQVMVSSETGGRILRLNVKEGEQVRRGKLIAELDLESVEKQISELETSLDLAQQVFERQKRLWDQNIGSEIQYLEAKSNKERLEKSLESLQLQLSKSKVYAPISGTVDMIITEAGEMVSPGAPIVMLLDTRRVKVVVDAPEKYLTTIGKGEKVKVSIPTINRETEERVSLIGTTIDPDNRTFKVEVEMPNPKGQLKPNLLANMKIVDFREENAVVIPLNLLQQEVGGKDYVFVKAEGEEGPIAKKVYVKTGESYDDQIVITEGLTGEEELIVEGARGLSDQELIQVQNPSISDNG